LLFNQELLALAIRHFQVCSITKMAGGKRWQLIFQERRSRSV